MRFEPGRTKVNSFQSLNQGVIFLVLVAQVCFFRIRFFEPLEQLHHFESFLGGR